MIISNSNKHFKVQCQIALIFYNKNFFKYYFNKQVMAHTNIVFGNETEADAFGKAMGYDTDNRIGKQQKKYSFK